MHPQIRTQALNDYQAANKVLGKGVRLRYTSVFRSFSEQAAIYAQGRTKAGKIVSNARAGYSYHNYGLAFDMVLLLDRNGDGVFETAKWDINADFDNDKKADWIEVANVLKGRGWEWGGDWKGFRDYPHFQKSFGIPVVELLRRYKQGRFISGTKYVIL